MYQNSYKGYKKKKYNFRNNYSSNKYSVRKASVKNPEATLTKLQIIRYSALILAVIIAFSVITIGMIKYNSGRNLPLEATVEADATDYREELLRVVNKNNPLSADFVPELKKYRGYSVNVLAADSLEMLLKDAKEQGIDLFVKTGYISFEDQESMFQQEYNRLLKDNLTEVKAEAKAQAVVPHGGESEAQTGLLITFGTSEKGSFEDTKASGWLENNCVDYGFVLRYTEAKKSKTLMSAKSDTYRYVGVTDASMMRSLDMCLNEYSAYISVRE